MDTQEGSPDQPDISSDHSNEGREPIAPMIWALGSTVIGLPLVAGSIETLRHTPDPRLNIAAFIVGAVVFVAGNTRAAMLAAESEEEAN